MSELEAECVLEDARCIRVVIIPIGDISPAKYKQFSGLVRHHDTIDLGEMLPEKSDCFPNQPHNGVIRIRYVEAHQYRSAWEDLQGHRKILGVIGIVHCPRCETLETAQREFTRAVAGFRHPPGRCYAFEPQPSHEDLGRGVDVVMIPNVGDVHQYLSTWTQDFARSLLKKLEEEFATIAKASIIHLNHMDEAAKEDIPKLTKRLPGRMAKCKGDLCLLAGSPVDALDYYKSAAELAKKELDWEWMAGSLEGAAATSFCSLLFGESALASSSSAFVLPSSPSGGEVEGVPMGGSDAVATSTQTNHDAEEIRDRLLGAAQLYGKRGGAAAHLRIECYLKLTRLFVEHADVCRDLSPMTFAPSAAVAANTALSFSRLTGATSCSAHTAQQSANLLLVEIAHLCSTSTLSSTSKIAVVSAVALLFFRMGWKRKAAQYMLRAARLLRIECNAMHCHAVLLRCADLYHMSLEDSESKSGCQWTALQLHVLKDLIKSARTMHDEASATAYVRYGLTHLRDAMSAEEQQALGLYLGDVSQRSPVSSSTSLSVRGRSLPVLTAIDVQPLSDAHRPHAVPRPEHDDGSFKFIYSPFQNKETKADFPTLVQEVPAVVVVTLSNPMPFAITIDRLSLRTTGARARCVVHQRVDLDAQAVDHKVALSAVPLEPGALYIQGCNIRACGMDSSIEIESAQRVEVGPITVVGALPSLAVDESSGFRTSIALLECECITTTLSVRNASGIPIHELSLEALQSNRLVQTPMEIAVQNPTLVAWNDDEIARQLPLQPGETLHVPITVTGRLDCINSPECEVTFTFKYREVEQSEFSRVLSIPVSVNVMQGLQLVHFSVLPSKPVEGSDRDMVGARCLLLLEVLNCCSYLFHLHYGVRESKEEFVTIGPNSGKRFILPVDRFRISDEAIEAVKFAFEVQEQFVRPSTSMSEYEIWKMRRAEAVKRALLQKLRIRWRSHYDMTGYLPFRTVELSEEMIQVVLIDELDVSVTIEKVDKLCLWPPSAQQPLSDAPETTASNTNVHLNNFYRVGMQISNRASRAKSIVVSLSEAPRSRSRSTPSIAKFVWSGQVTAEIAQLGPQSVHTHYVGMCVLVAGEHPLQVCCRETETERIYTRTTLVRAIR